MTYEEKQKFLKDQLDLLSDAAEERICPQRRS